MSLALKRCTNHPGREAVARCPDCARFYCRECITEHEDRVICAVCLKRLVGGAEERRSRWAVAGRLVSGLAGLLIAWIVFYGAGRALLAIPTAFHDGTIWAYENLTTD